LKPRTILHTIETGGPGGAETILLHLASRLDPTRFRSLVLVPEPGWLLDSLRASGMTAHIVPMRGRLYRTLREMARWVRNENVDLIHSHLPDQNFHASLVGRMTGRPVVATYHGALDLSRARSAIKMRLARRFASATVAVSRSLAESLYAGGFARERVVCIYNGVDTERFSVTPSGRLRAELGCANGTKLIGMVANLRRDKGYEYFVRSARLVAERVPHAHFVAVGEGSAHEVEGLQRLAADLGLGSRFSLLGFRSNVPELLTDLDVFVLSSTSEGFSLATVEAMAAARPVVVTRSGGPEELVEHGRTGLLVPPADAETLAAQVCEVLASPSLAEELGRNARRSVEQRFSLPRMLVEYENLYQRLLGD
jgi:glycosyltransferase involved in cell wall biosynthesis